MSSGLIVSGIETTDWFQDMRFDDNSDWRDSHIVMAVVLITFVLVIVAYHFAEAWRTLPGAYYVSGNINLDIVIEENLVSATGSVSLPRPPAPPPLVSLSVSLSLLK